jgi:hypothetical protein
MKLCASWAEATEVVGLVLGLVGFRLHISCNRLRCFRRELSPTGFCRRHQHERTT